MESDTALLRRKTQRDPKQHDHMQQNDVSVSCCFLTGPRVKTMTLLLNWIMGIETDNRVDAQGLRLHEAEGI